MLGSAAPQLIFSEACEMYMFPPSGLFHVVVSTVDWLLTNYRLYLIFWFSCFAAPEGDENHYKTPKSIVIRFENDGDWNLTSVLHLRIAVEAPEPDALCSGIVGKAGDITGLVDGIPDSGFVLGSSSAVFTEALDIKYDFHFQYFLCTDISKYCTPVVALKIKPAFLQISRY